MNRKLDMVYLEGADSYFGPDQGSSAVLINTRRNYSKECPSVLRFLKKYSMTVESENDLMGMILDEGLEPKAAAKKWMKKNWTKVETWLGDLKTLSGESAANAVKKAI